MGMNWSDILTGRAPEIQPPTPTRTHALGVDTDDEPESDADLAYWGLNRTYGKLTVLRMADCKRGIRWWCLCECGKTKAIVGSELKAGKHKTCGCGQRSGPVPGYAKYGHPCACGCGQITERYKVVKGMTKACARKHAAK